MNSLLEHGIKPNYSVVSFMGSDGIGKSEISQSLANQLIGIRGEEVIHVVGSNPEQWNIPLTQKLNMRIDFYNRFALAKTQSQVDQASRDEYKAIIVPVYTYINSIVEQGRKVILDSDPVYKYLMWEVLHGTTQLKSVFQDVQAMLIRQGVCSMPGTAVYVRPQLDSHQAAGEVWDRLNKRELSICDPKDLAATRRRLSACETVYTFLEKQKPDLLTHAIPVYSVQPTDLSSYVERKAREAGEQLIFTGLPFGIKS